MESVAIFSARFQNQKGRVELLDSRERESLLSLSGVKEGSGASVVARFGNGRRDACLKQEERPLGDRGE
jgi:hypothetical protein